MMHVDNINTKTTTQTESDEVGVTHVLVLCSVALYSGVYVIVHRGTSIVLEVENVACYVVCHNMAHIGIFGKFFQICLFYMFVGLLGTVCHVFGVTHVLILSSWVCDVIMHRGKES